MNSYLWPNGLSSKPRVSSPYGIRVHPITGKVTMHNGEDLVGFAYNCAPNDGRVTVAGWNGDAGVEVRIAHDDGNMTRILHNADGSLQVRNGQRVSRGQRVARMGTTGASTGVHTHFETYDHGTRIDPDVFMARYGVGGSPAGNQDGDWLMALSDADQRQLKDRVDWLYMSLIVGAAEGSPQYSWAQAVLNELRGSVEPALSAIQQGGIAFPGAPYNAFEALANQGNGILAVLGEKPELTLDDAQLDDLALQLKAGLGEALADELAARLTKP